MDPSRDPRKRRPSRSPDGGVARKQLKNADSGHASPVSSSVEAPGKLPAPNPRNKPTTQGENPLFVDSPIPVTSLEDDTSGESTPLLKSNGSTASNIESNPVVDLLMNFTSQVAQQAALQVARDQAKSRVSLAKLEYEHGRSKFQDFPAIAEAKTAQMKAARKDLEAKDDRLNKHLVSQAELVNALAQIIGQSQQRTDVVSREQFDSLSTTCRGFQRELDEAKSTIASLKLQLAGVGQNAEATTRKQLDAFKDKELQKFAAKEPFKRLDTQFTSLSRDLSDIKTSMNGDFVKQVQKLAEQGPALVEKVDKLQEKADNNEKSVDQLSASLKAQESTGTPELVQKVDTLQQELAHTKKSVQQIEKDMHEEGQEPLLKRVKDLDGRVNKLDTDVRRDIKILCEGAPRQKALAETSVDPAAVTAQVDQLRTDIDNRLSIIEEDIQGTTTIVTDFVKEQIAPLNEQFTKIRQDLEEAQSLKASLDAVEKNLADFMAKDKDPKDVLRFKDFVTFRDDLDAWRRNMSMRIEKLEALIRQHGSPVPNSTHTPLSHRNSSQMNGVEQVPQSPSHSQDLKTIQAQVNQLAGQCNQLTNVTRSQQQRFDNLLTDEMARKMLDQMTYAYPHAKNFEAAVQELKSKAKALEGRLDTLRSSKDEALKQLAQVVTDVKTLRQAIDHKIGYAVDDISKDWAPKLSEMKLKMHETLDEHSRRLDGHDKMCELGEQKLKELENDKQTLMNRMASYEGESQR